MSDQRHRTRYMRAYRIRYGITNKVFIPSDVLARILTGDDGSAELARHLGPDMCRAVIERHAAHETTTMDN